MRIGLVSAVAVPVALALSGCSTIETLPFVSDLPKLPIPDALRIETSMDKPATPIERALSDCGTRTEAGESACVKAALAAGTISMPALIAMLPGCRAGQVCHTTYTTKENIGLYGGIASHFVARWRVEVDLRHAAAVSAVPVTVTQV